MALDVHGWLATISASDLKRVPVLASADGGVESFEWRVLLGAVERPVLLVN